MTKQRKPENKLKFSVHENGKNTDKQLLSAQKRDEGKIPVRIDNKTIKLVNP